MRPRRLPRTDGDDVARQLFPDLRQWAWGCGGDAAQADQREAAVRAGRHQLRLVAIGHLIDDREQRRERRIGLRRVVGVDAARQQGCTGPRGQPAILDDLVEGRVARQGIVDLVVELVERVGGPLRQ